VLSTHKRPPVASKGRERGHGETVQRVRVLEQYISVIYEGELRSGQRAVQQHVATGAQEGNRKWRACRLTVDSSSDMPPERKWMPGTAGGMLRIIVRTVNFATSSGDATGASRPGRIMLGLSRIASVITSYSFSMRNTCEYTRSDLHACATQVRMTCDLHERMSMSARVHSC
jgi:hypothetical protein